MESLELAYFTARILQCFQETKNRNCAELLELSNQPNSDCVVPSLSDTSDIDKIATLYSELLLQSHLESEFLDFVNHYPDKITDDDVNNWRLFYSQFKHWRFR
jgi:hypothetical protein